MKIISQILGIVAFLFFVFSIQTKDKKKIIGMQLFSNFFYTLSYLIINAMSAVMVNVVLFIRCIFYYYFENKKNKIPFVVMIFLVILSIIVGIFIVKDIFDVLPIIICIIYIITTYQKKLLIIQLGFLLGAFLWIIYNFHVGTYTPLIENVFEIISGVVAIIRTKKMSSRKEK